MNNGCAHGPHLLDGNDTCVCGARWDRQAVIDAINAPGGEYPGQPVRDWEEDGMSAIGSSARRRAIEEVLRAWRDRKLTTREPYVEDARIGRDLARALDELRALAGAPVRDLNADDVEILAADVVEVWTGDRRTRGQALRDLARLTVRGLDRRGRLLGVGTHQQDTATQANEAETSA